MGWVITGSCTHCGKCCKNVSLGGFMLENPCMDPSWDYCAFYTDDVDPSLGKFGHCLIMQAKRNYRRVRDRFGNKMTEEQIRWFEENCPQWPSTPRDINDIVSGRVKLPPECGFSIKWVDD